MNLSDIKTMSREDLLENLGLATKRTAMDWVTPGLGLFATGLLLGVGLGLLFAPKPGAQLRAGLKERLSTMSEKPTNSGVDRTNQTTHSI